MEFIVVHWRPWLLVSVASGVTACFFYRKAFDGVSSKQALWAVVATAFLNIGLLGLLLLSIAESIDILKVIT